MNKYGGGILSLLFLGSFLLTGCLTTGNQPVGQAAVKDFETRTVDAPFAAVYAAATEGLFDLGYTIGHSDKGTGVLVGEKRVKKGPALLVELADIMDHRERSQEDYYEMLQLTIYIQPIDDKNTKLRIKTAVDKSPKFDKEAIDEVWLYIQRQVLMEGGASTVASEKKETTSKSEGAIGPKV